MTTEEKIKIIKMNEEGVGVRQIARELSVQPGTIVAFLATKTVRFESCPVCGKAVPVKNIKGRRAIYCSPKCRNSDYKENHKRRHVKCVCEQCGKEYFQYTFVKSRFCSRSCAMKHRYEKQRIHEKSS